MKELLTMSELGRLVRFEIVPGPFGHVAFFFDDGLRPVVRRIYLPGRRD